MSIISKVFCNLQINVTQRKLSFLAFLKVRYMSALIEKGGLMDVLRSHSASFFFRFFSSGFCVGAFFTTGTAACPGMASKEVSNQPRSVKDSFNGDG